jgi:hypothetical protein
MEYKGNDPTATIKKTIKILMNNYNLIDPVYFNIIRDLTNIITNIDSYDNDTIEFFSIEIRPISESLDEAFKNNDKNTILSKLELLSDIIDANKSQIERNQRAQQTYNSKNFYEVKILSIKQEKEKLEKQLIDKEQTSSAQKEELDLRKKEIEQRNVLIKKYKEELENIKKQDDATKEWKDRIEKTFIELKKYLTPIEKEHYRLDKMFYIYSRLAGFVLFLLFLIEFISCYKLHDVSSFPDFKNYIILFIPVPVAGASLWAFVCQMNRAQRQLVILSQYMHEIEYVEGLLLSINSLSPNIDDAVKRINATIDKMISNHLDLRKNNAFSEEKIIKETKKDGMPYDVFIKILDGIKDITK